MVVCQTSKAIADFNPNIQNPMELNSNPISLRDPHFLEHAAIVDFLQFAKTTKDPVELKEHRVRPREND